MRLLPRSSIFFLLAWIAGADSACAGFGTNRDAQTIGGFLQAVYARYTADAAPLDIDDARSGMIYDSSLLALMREDRRVLHGEAGVLDADPLCACQDHDIRKVTWVLTPTSDASWSARVSFENLGSKQHVVLSLVRTARGWRVADVQSEAIPRLRASLQDEIATSQKLPQPSTP